MLTMTARSKCYSSSILIVYSDTVLGDRRITVTGLTIRKALIYSKKQHLTITTAYTDAFPVSRGCHFSRTSPHLNMSTETGFDNYHRKFTS